MTKTKFIFITGGVCSGLGKGIASASIGAILKSAGYSVFTSKMDPYLNIDPGTMSPYQHGEVFVTDDGTETDLDLGHYERFIDTSLSKLSNLTTGRVYDKVLKGERSGDYLGKTIQIVPHITEEIKKYIKKAASESKADFLLTEMVTKGESNIIKNENKAEKVLISDSEEYKINTTTEKIINLAPAENKIVSTISEYVWPIKISEFMPNPAGSDLAEFIELYNYGETEINLTGLKLDDGEGGSRPYVFPENTKIASQSYLTVAAGETKISLNNTDDAARLLDANDKIIDEVLYEDVVEGASFAQDDKGVWFWSTSVTPGKNNIIKPIFLNKTTATSKSKILGEVAVEDIKDKDVGSRVKVSGAVAVLPGVLGTQYFYIVNEVAGVQIYMYKKDFPDLSVGEMISVSGEISEAYGEKRIKVARQEDIVKLGENRIIEPRVIEIAEIEESLVGSLVQVSGEITEIKSSYMYLDDGMDEIKIYFKNGANIDKKEFKVGDNAQVSGMLIERSDGYQIQPRFQDDLKKINSTNIAAQNENKQKETAEKYLTTTAVGLSSILVGLFIKARGSLLIKLVKKFGMIALSFVKRK